ncbi:type III polyketide synthase [Paenibacillus polymyxa]|uniref:type III polyketide synthase n=1 Tax=Paenibacillus polymyxa TaxID=1406 RepID=UPI001BE5EFF4|nr:type III polyketide synthase [Paenibacillus polymyxa]MBT2282869.1 type III polyketide synthase [Paenibacillus polymyxa]
MNQLEATTGASIMGIGTAWPAHRIEQKDVSARLAQALEHEPDARRWAKRIFNQCGVETRYTCEPNLLEPVDSCRYLPFTNAEEVPTTSERMGKYKAAAVPLGLEAAGQALQDADVTSSEITHLITVSCTGQFLPGLDVRLIQQLELSPQINRIPLVFQGCAAGLKAIQLANSIVTTDQKATVLIVCVELCTLHFQPSAKRDDLYAASFFGDGASACVIGASGTDRNECFRLGRGHSTLLPDCAEEMIWEVGNTGFDLYLSPQIPKLLGLHLGPEVERLLEGSGLPEIWAIHPGGRGIVDAVQKLYQLTDQQVSYSRNILRDYGNLSSVTILFVLQAIREDYRQKEEHSSGIALAFGPGLTAELLPFTYIPAPVANRTPVNHGIQ